MYDEGWSPDLIMCSDSVRTRQTLEAMQAAYPALTVGSPSRYLCGPGRLALGKGLQSSLMFGLAVGDEIISHRPRGNASFLYMQTWQL